MSDNGNLVLGDFAKAGYQSRALNEDEAQLLNKNDQSHFLEAHYKAVALEDLQAVLNLYVSKPLGDEDVYSDFGKMLAGFRHEQSKIVSAYVPSIRGACNMASIGAKPYDIVEHALHPELEASRRKIIPVGSKSYPKYYLHAVASETGHAIFGFLEVLAKIEDEYIKSGKTERIKLYGYLGQNLTAYAMGKYDGESLFKTYVEGIYKHINAARDIAKKEAGLNDKSGNVIPFDRRHAKKSKPTLTIVK